MHIIILSSHAIEDFTFKHREAGRMGKQEHLDPKSQKIHQNWTKIKHQKSQVNGETEVTLHNQMLRSAAKSKQF